jgi:4-alpha-glucanotransferase
VAYDSWWGFADLPNVNENDLSYRDYILGNNGVIRSWLKKGAAGFRLDVSDELPDSFLRELRSVVKESSDYEGVVLGEVWEDASNKISYGSYRDFLLGNTHDSVMGYTFRDTLLGFLTGAFAAQNLNARLESYRENYPPEAYYCIMNVISTHDVPRAITVIGGVPDPGDREKQSLLSLDEAGWKKGLALMRLAIVIQMGYVGSPCIYYGDEIGMQGYRDPFNRRTYPWDRVSDMQTEQLIFYQNITGLRRRYPVLRTGFYRTLLAQDDVFVFERYLDNEQKDFFGKLCEGARRVVFAINRSENNMFSFFLNEEIGIIEMFFSHDIIKENLNSEENSNFERLIGDSETNRTTVRPLSFQILVYV